MALSDVLSALSFIAIYGISYGVVLFTISVGLVVMMGLMRVVNMAHGVFAAVGGYITVSLMNAHGVPFAFAALIAVLAVAAGSVIIERIFFVKLYGAPELDHVLMTIGLMFIGMAGLNLVFGPDIVPAHLPNVLTENVQIGDRTLQVYRIFIVGFGAVLMIALWYVFERTSFGARLRAAVDNRGMAEAVGINVRRLFSMAFALGSGLAAVGGAVGLAVLPLEPTYAFKYLVLILIVVSMSGIGNLKASAWISIALGVIDTAGRYFHPEAGGFIIYGVLIAWMVFRGHTLLQAPSAR
ncbi:MAG: branched-chain amino acid ABC transporter permease [Burkholderiales bacterium]